MGDGAVERHWPCGRLRIPKSVYWLGRRASGRLSVLWRRVTIPENIGRIPDRMFEGCANLKKVELHEKLGVIGERAFFGCSSLRFYYNPGQCKTDRAGCFY